MWLKPKFFVSILHQSVETDCKRFLLLILSVVLIQIVKLMAIDFAAHFIRCIDSDS